ncbi:dihydrofolate reductase family protein [Achromobacter xylosoxidans]|uniref:dihydrofolate reductase family protein n=1 Tax=Alcaligenes xylosoxydans xylosoxydans TaxID=85698 RepID=UPI000B48D790|nr:dihydrofolate reductase family protein [Achromobacter xylosoxidans]
MALHCSSFIATSLDGYISREDGGLDWLDSANQTVPAGEDCGYGAYMKTVDALVMGRATFEKVASFPEWPYGGMPVYVLSRSMASLPASAPASVRLHGGSLEELLERAGADGCKSLYIDGGKTVQSFIQAGLLSDITITVIPVLIGGGRRLFGELAKDVALRHAATVAYPFGFVQSRYALEYGAAR